jgi:hypothetical protein
MGPTLAAARQNGHLCAPDEDWDDENASIQSGGDFKSYEIFGIVEPRSTLIVFCCEPVPPDDRQQDIARADVRIYGFAKVNTRREAVNVHKNIRFPEPVLQAIKQSSRIRDRILPSIADE